MLPGDGRFDLARLRAFADEFDAISDEDGGVRYSAVEFVDWLGAEAGCSRSNLTNACAANAARSTLETARRFNERRRQTRI